VTRVDELRARLQGRAPFFASAVDRAEASFGEEWSAGFEETLTRLFPDDDQLAAAAEGYARFAMDLMRRQSRFERERVYPAKSYAEAAAEVYLDADFMAAQYLPGLLIAHYLWAHHYRHLVFFERAFLGAMAGATTFAEVGVGTGLYSRLTLQARPAITGRGYDISPASKAFADAHVAAFGAEDRFETILQDIVADPIPPAPWLICVEVLEHLEDPPAFLAALRAALLPGGHAFITAALNAANVDHIYLYEGPDQVAAQLHQAGFETRESFLANAYAPAAPDTPVPAVAAFVVS
jgi:SAM-dependent methyltransferase